MWGLNDLTGPTSGLPGRAGRAQSRTSGHANRAGGCCQGLSPSLPHREVVTVLIWVLLGNAVAAGARCVTPGFPPLPPPPAGLQRQRGPAGMLPRGRQGGHPHTIWEIWDHPELRAEFRSPREATRPMLPPPLAPLLPSLPALRLDRRSESVYP